MAFSEYGFLINTVILIIIFFYQKNKNKVLLDRISQQEKVITETAGIIKQQSTAIDNQKKIVETALMYSETFAPDKIELIIRREIEIEQKEKRGELEAKIIDLEKIEKQNYNLYYDNIANMFVEDYITPYVREIIILMIRMSPEEHHGYIASMDGGKAKDVLLKMYNMYLTESIKREDKKKSNASIKE